MRRFWKKELLSISLLYALAVFSMHTHNAQAQGPGTETPLPGEQKILGLTEGAERLTLERCIEIVLEKNPEIAAVQWDISAAESRFDVAKAAFWPWLRLDGSFQQDRNDQRLLPTRYNGEPGVFDDQILRSNVSAIMTLYSGGRISSEADAAEKLSEAEKKKFIRTREELVYAVSAVYYSILGQQKIIGSLEFSRRALDEHMTRVVQLYDAQKVAKVDILRTEVRLINLEQNLLKQENTLAVRKRILFSLMGLKTALENAEFREKLEFAETPNDMHRLVETAMKNRSDYQAAIHRMEAQSFRVEAAQAGHLPNVNLVGTYGVKNAPSPDDIGRNAESTVDVGSVGVILTIPLFEGGRVSAKVRQETETATLDVQSDMAQVKATQKSIEQAKESFRIESLKYDLGKGSITDVLDSQAAQLESETTYYQAQTDYFTSVARLKLATGETL
jgi:outer membrane protein